MITLLLKPSQVQADWFKFSNSNCHELIGSNWITNKNCGKESDVYSLNKSPNLFCSYDLKKGESVFDAIKKVRFYRKVNSSVLLNYKSGRSTDFNSKAPKNIIFSKRDLLMNKNSPCSPLNQSANQANSFYVLHKPNSFYVLKSGLKKISVKYNGEHTRVRNTIVKNETDAFSNLGLAHSLTVKPRLFYEKIEGRQITNSTSATISGKLSPGLTLKFTKGEHKNWQYGATVDLDFHIFDERAGEFLLNNNTVQTLALNIFSNFELNKTISTQFMISLYEDLYYARTSPSSLGLEKELVPRLSLSTKIKLLSGQRLGLFLLPQIFYDLASGPLMSGLGYSAPLVFEFRNNNQVWSAGVEYFSLKKELSDLELERSALSFFVETKVFF